MKEQKLYILQGFVNVFINECKNESHIINYFDTLRALRYEDVRMLLYLSGLTEDPLKNNEEGNSEHILSKQIYSKLKRLYLIKSASTLSYLEYGPEAKEEELRPRLTPYGKNFLKFITLNFDEEAYEEKMSDYDNSSEDIAPRIRVMEEDIAKPKIAKFG